MVTPGGFGMTTSLRMVYSLARDCERMAELNGFDHDAVLDMLDEILSGDLDNAYLLGTEIHCNSFFFHHTVVLYANSTNIAV
jgi:hypothetical protein